MKATVLAMFLNSILAAGALAQPTAFMYQGRLKNGAQAANGLHDFRFKLFDAASGGNQLGTTQCVDNAGVAAGMFAATVDFGPQFATPAPRFLEVEVRAETGLDCATTTGFVILTPRQPLTPAPLAVHAHAAYSLDAPDGSPTSAVFVSNDGRVGIGTTNPGGKLDIQGTNSSNVLFGRRTGGGLAHNLYIDSAGNGSMQLLDSASTPRVEFANGLTYFNYGNVGIGTSTPAAILHARGLGPAMILQDTAPAANQAGYLGFWNSSGSETGWMGFGSAGSPDLSVVNARSFGDIVLQPGTAGGNQVRITNGGVLELYNTSGVRKWLVGYAGLSGTGSAEMRLIANNGTTRVLLFETGTQGAIQADVKNFRVPNPDDPSTDIVYACIEGPEAAMYTRGTGTLVAGRATIAMPDHFRALAMADGMTVQVTPLSAGSRGLCVVSKSPSAIEVRELAGGTGTYEFDWEVKAVRRDQQDYRPVRHWTESQPQESTSTEDRWEARLRDIELRERRLRELEAGAHDRPAPVAQGRLAERSENRP